MSLGRWSFRLRSPRAGLIIGAGKRFRSFSQRSNGGLPQSVAGRLTPDDLTILGPVHATKLKASTSGLLPKYAVDLWMVPDGSRILDLSTRCKPQRLFDIATEARKFPCAPRAVSRKGCSRPRASHHCNSSLGAPSSFRCTAQREARCRRTLRTADHGGSTILFILGRTDGRRRKVRVERWTRRSS